LHLKLDLTNHVHKTKFKKFDLFSTIGSKSFLIWISQNLKPFMAQESDYCYKEGDEINTFYFMTSGQAAFVIQKQENAIYAVIDPDKSIDNPKTKQQ